MEMLLHAPEWNRSLDPPLQYSGIALLLLVNLGIHVPHHIYRHLKRRRFVTSYI